MGALALWFWISLRSSRIRLLPSLPITPKLLPPDLSCPKFAEEPEIWE